MLQYSILNLTCDDPPPTENRQPVYIYTVEIQYSGVLFIMCSLILIHIYHITLCNAKAAKQIKYQNLKVSSKLSLASLSAINT